MTKDKTQTTMEKCLSQRLGFRRVINSFVNKIEEVKEEDDHENIETFIVKVKEKLHFVILLITVRSVRN